MSLKLLFPLPPECSCVSVFSSLALFGEPSTSPVFVVGASTQVLCERVEGSLNTEEVLTGLRINSPTGIPECGADALRSTLCSTSFKKPSPQTMSGGGCVLR
ncbi:uncharacterized protein LOC135100907 isoform X1 [Scylla paramamosain]|uniref:uncharacterized protein LOC135100907 isoform X1 n=1 Tax=Scylla paramamosain TaxID=85552 RepID=UPI0030828D98